MPLNSGTVVVHLVRYLDAFLDDVGAVLSCRSPREVANLAGRQREEAFSPLYAVGGLFPLCLAHICGRKYPEPLLSRGHSG